MSDVQWRIQIVFSPPASKHLLLGEHFLAKDYTSFFVFAFSLLQKCSVFKTYFELHAVIGTRKILKDYIVQSIGESTTNCISLNISVDKNSFSVMKCLWCFVFNSKQQRRLRLLLPEDKIKQVRLKHFRSQQHKKWIILIWNICSKKNTLVILQSC